MLNKESEAENGPISMPEVVVNYKTPIRGPKQKEAYLDKYLIALLEGRLAVPRRNMRLDYAAEDVAKKCIKCCPNNPEARSILALEIIERSPYVEAKSAALNLLNEEVKTWANPVVEQSQFLSSLVQRLIAVSDLSGKIRFWEKVFRIKSFGVAANIAGILTVNSPRLSDYFPLFSQSLVDETDEECFANKFLAISRYFEATLWTMSHQAQEEKLKQLLGHAQNKIDGNDPLKAIDIIFSILRQYTHDCLRDVVFKRSPFNLATLQKICREAPPSRKKEVVIRVHGELENLLSLSYHDELASPNNLRHALIIFAFRDITQNEQIQTS